MLAMSPPPAEQLPQLEAEVALLRQAVLLCDQMLTARGSVPGSGRSTGGPPAATAPAAPSTRDLRQGQAGLPCSARQQAGPAGAGSAASEQRQGQQAAPAAASPQSMDRKRQAAVLKNAAGAGIEEGSPCMAGRHQLEGALVVSCSLVPAQCLEDNDRALGAL